MSDKVFKIRIKKGDNVVIRSGKYKGQKGKVLATHPRLNKVTVEGINIAKVHKKPDKTNPQGGIFEVTKPLWVSKVAIVDPHAKKHSRITYKLNADGSKSRVFKASGKEIK